jgi:predicted metal-binding membrane protein
MRQGPGPDPASERAFYSVAALVFATSATLTVMWCAAMSAMDGMSMPGGWSMSMAWMRMPEQTWIDAAGSFLAMWMAMMVAMMLPSLLPMLSRYRSAVGRTGEARLGRLTMLVGGGYFFVWAVLGLTAFPVGAMVASIEMQVPAIARAVPFATGAIVMLAGALQLTRWKARQLASCRHSACAGSLRPDAATAWRHGMRLGIHCAHCCAGLTVILLVVGVMDLRAMAAVTVAISLERLAPAGERIARAIGVLMMAFGSWMTMAAL